jgi:hypothetical protein
VQPSAFRLFAHLATPNVALYRRVMGEFVAAKRRFVVHLRTEDLQEALARAEPNGHVSMDALADALGQLVEWGNLRADPDTSRVTTVEDFHRARFLYQLTNAQAFMGSLRRTIELHDADVEAFLAYKDRLVDYLERFIKDLRLQERRLPGLVLPDEARHGAIVKSCG